MYSEFGKFLSQSSRDRAPVFDASIEAWQQAYNQNLARFSAFKSRLAASRKILIVGAGPIDLDCLPSKNEGWFYCGVPWAAFNPGLALDAVLSNHTCALESALIYSQDTASDMRLRDTYFIQSSASPVPPIYEKSVSIQWSNLYPMLPSGSSACQASEVVLNLGKDRVNTVLPFVPAVPNVVFVIAYLACLIGVDQISFAGVDPLNPVYFFDSESLVLSNIVRCLSQCDPWIAEWDGGTHRIPILHRDSSNRLLLTIRGMLASQTSGVSAPHRQQWMREGLLILASLSKANNISLSFSGQSQFLELNGVPRL